MINQRVCEGCGDCGEKSNCLSVQPIDTDFGRKTAIDQSSCNKDYSCLKGDCPSFLTVIPSAKPRGRRAAAPALASDGIPDPPLRFDVARAPHTTRITGVGGTGVVTLSQVLSAAGRIAGRQVRSLDQTGLAQKGGAVISDVKISAGEIEQSNKAAAGECDLYLGCDLLVAADAKNLAVADPETTIAVVSTTKVPTGKMVTDTTVPFPDVDATTDRIRSATRAADSVFVDARGLSVTLFGSDQFANMLLAGVAFQTGAPAAAGPCDRAGDRVERRPGRAEPAGVQARSAERGRAGRIRAGGRCLERAGASSLADRTGAGANRVRRRSARLGTAPDRHGPDT